MTETATKHTPYALTVGEYDAEIVGYRLTAPGFPCETIPAVALADGSAVALANGRDKAHALANAKRLALVWNCHDPLLAACQGMLETFRYYFGDDDCPNSRVAKAAIAQARA